MPLLYANVSSGDAVSATIDLSQYGRPVAINVPAITSGDLLVHGSFTTTSADFVRMIETRSPGSGDLRFATGPGSRMVLWPDALNKLPPYVRLEVSSQTDTRSFVILVR